MIPEPQRTRIAELLTDYCEATVPQHVRDKVRLSFRMEGNVIDLFELRPAFQAPRKWQEEGVARFRYVQSRGVWRLYCEFSDLRWHEYEPFFEARTFDELLTEVDRDPTGIFWG
jgi:DUF3024 family protein